VYWVPVKGGSDGKKGSGRECEEGQEGLNFLIQGLGAFQEDFVPLSSRSTVEVCVIPVLL